MPGQAGDGLAEEQPSWRGRGGYSGCQIKCEPRVCSWQVRPAFEGGWLADLGNSLSLYPGEIQHATWDVPWGPLGPSGQEDVQKRDRKAAGSYGDGQGHRAHASSDEGGCGFSV